MNSHLTKIGRIIPAYRLPFLYDQRLRYLKVERDGHSLHVGLLISLLKVAWPLLAPLQMILIPMRGPCLLRVRVHGLGRLQVCQVVILVRIVLNPIALLTPHMVQEKLILRLKLHLSLPSTPLITHPSFLHHKLTRPFGLEL